MKYTLLDLVQTIMSSMDSDEVNNINDTSESMQVATLIRTVYFDIINRANLPEHNSLITLDASTDGDKPTLMSVPNTVQHVEWIKYNVATVEDPELNMRDLMYLTVEEFLRMTYALDPTEDNVSSFQLTIGSDIFTIQYRNDKAPDYYTTFNDNTILFDSFDSDVDSTLQKSKTLAAAKMVIPFSMTDTFIPDLDDAQFSLLLNEAKSLAWLELKQTSHSKAEQSARRGWTNLQKTKNAVKTLSDFEQLPSFGRVKGQFYGRS